MNRTQEIQNQIDYLNKQIESGVSMHAADTYRQQISVLETEKAQLVELEKLDQKHEIRVQESQTEIANILDNLEVSGLTMRQMCASEDDYQVLRIRFQKVYEQQADAFSKQLKGYEEREIQLTRQNESLQARNLEVEEENAKLSEENGKLSDMISKIENEREDAESKRDAAVRELESVRGEVKQLKEWNDDLRTQMALGVGGSLKVIDPEEKARQDAEEQERIERIKAQRTVYDLKGVEPINPKNYTAKRALDGETVTINWTQLRSYIVLEDQEEVNSFRLKHAPKENIEATIPLDPPALPIITEQQFPESNRSVDQQAACTSDGFGTSGYINSVTDDASVSLADRVEALEARVAQLEHQRTNVA
jgi:cell division protein FtsB